MTIQFPDRSNHDGQLPAAGLVALVAKATESTNFYDSTYDWNRSRATALGIPFCAYHFLHNHDVPAQAAWAFQHVGSTPLMLDWETTTSGEKPDIAAATAFIGAYRALGGVLHLAYLPRWYWQQIGSPDLRPLAAMGISIVSSNYTSYSDTGPGWAPYGGVTPAIWQYSGTPDWNAYRGTPEQLRALFNGTPPPQPQEDSMQVIIRSRQTGWVGVADFIHRRHIASIQEWKTLEARLGATLDVDEAQLDWYGVDVQAPGEPLVLTDEVKAEITAAAKAGAPTHDELVAAAEEGANRAEDS